MALAILASAQKQGNLLKGFINWSVAARSMVIRVVKFSSGGYKTGKIFA